MSKELYRKEFKVLEDGKVRIMIAKATRHFSSGSKKLASVHISPITYERCDGYGMELISSGDSCMRLVFSKHYSIAQSKAMNAEIRTLAKEKLSQFSTEKYNEEHNAYRNCLEYLSNQQ